MLANEIAPRALADLVRYGYWPGQERIVDAYGRVVTYLRVSLTDRCNLRCLYCMPPEGIPWLPCMDLLSFEEIVAIVEAAAACGVTKVRLTGGEPLVRKDLPNLIGRIARLPGIEDLALTTNGVLLASCAQDLAHAGLRRVNVSLDTLEPEKFRRITRLGHLGEVLKGLEAAADAGLAPLKVNTVIMGGLNDKEAPDLAGLTVKRDLEVRFIEYMPLDESGGCTRTGDAIEFVPSATTREYIESVLGPLQPLPSQGEYDGPALRFRIPGARGSIGFIGAMSVPFCERCNRLRLTANGELRSCLLDGGVVDVRSILRSGGGRNAVIAALRRTAELKPKVHQYLAGAFHGAMSRIGG
ncbi:MAG: cyclic pyranopterin monophosphate synthase [Planctomycetota bacterium]